MSSQMVVTSLLLLLLVAAAADLVVMAPLVVVAVGGGGWWPYSSPSWDNGSTWQRVVIFRTPLDGHHARPIQRKLNVLTVSNIQIYYNCKKLTNMQG